MSQSTIILLLPPPHAIVTVSDVLDLRHRPQGNHDRLGRPFASVYFLGDRNLISAATLYVVVATRPLPPSLCRCPFFPFCPPLLTSSKDVRRGCLSLLRSTPALLTNRALLPPL